MFKKIFLLCLLLTSCGPTVHEEAYTPVLSTQELEDSLNVGTQFLLNHQKEAGNFDYEYDFSTGTLTEDDNQVRQAGALWGLATIYQNNPTDEMAAAIEKGLNYFKTNSVLGESGRYIVYPGDSEGSTGTMALVVLTLVDYLRTEGSNPSYESDLEEYLSFLLSLRKENGQFSSSYDFETGEGTKAPSPYFDGEALLATVSAAKYQSHSELAEDLEESAENMYEDYVEEALEDDPDSAETKGFYQWGSMAFYELYTSEWSKKDYANWTIDMAYWMVDTHDVLGRSKNTGYAYEGLIVAYELAHLTENKKAQDKLAAVVDEGLNKLTLWQVTPTDTADPLAIGGIRNETSGTTLRIDTTQHQMHAVILALKYLY